MVAFNDVVFILINVIAPNASVGYVLFLLIEIKVIIFAKPAVYYQTNKAHPNKPTKQGCNLHLIARKHKQKLWDTLQNPLESSDFMLREHVTYTMLPYVSPSSYLAI
jgi:hypothetical protein